MKNTSAQAIGKAQNRFMPFRSAVVLIFLIGSTVFSAPPTAENEASVAGSWRISGKDFERRYEISAGRNIKILGSGIKEKRGRLVPQEDGSYLVHLDGDVVLRLKFTQANDQLVVECFTKQNLQLGLSAMWKTTGVRIKP